MIFSSIIEANKYMGFHRNSANISQCCKLKRKSAGKINGERAIWMYYDEYLSSSSNDLILLAISQGKSKILLQFAQIK